MNFKNRTKSIMTVFLLVIMIFTSTSASAAGMFKDVPDNWARPYIENAAKNGYMMGIGEGKFAPTKSLTIMEMLTLTSRFMDISDAEMQIILKNHQARLNRLKVQHQWQKEALAVGFEYELLPTDLLDNLVKNGDIHGPISRKDMAFIFAKGMGLGDEANKLKVVILGYKDEAKIPESYRKYVKVLLDAGILDVKGDGTGNFNPGAALSRQEMAKILSEGHKHKNKFGKDKDTPTVPKEEPVVKGEVKGTFQRITKEIGKEFFVIKDRDGKEVSFEIAGDESVFTIDKKPANKDAYTTGQEVVVNYTSKDFKKLISVDGEYIQREHIGQISSFNPLKDNIEIRVLEDDGYGKYSYTFSTASKGTRDGEKIEYFKLREGDFIKFETAQNKLIVKFEAYSKDKDFKGEVIDVQKEIAGNELSELRVDIADKNSKDKKEDIILLLMSDDTKVTRDGRPASRRAIKKTDNVYINAEYNIEEELYEAVEVVARPVIKDISGVVLEITAALGKNQEIKIRDDKGGEEIYELTPNVRILVDGKLSDNLPLNPGYIIKLKVEGGDTIREAHIETSSLYKPFSGRVIEVDPGSEYVLVKYTGLFGEEERDIKVHLDRGTRFIKRDSMGKEESIPLKNIEVGDFVFVEGKMIGARFTANLIRRMH